MNLSSNRNSTKLYFIVVKMVRRALCLARNLLSEHTYDVQNTRNPSRSQEIEVTHNEANALIKNFNKTKNVSLLWNHGLDRQGKSPIGKILDVYKEGDGLFAIADQYDGVINRVVEAGAIDNVSMHHCRPGSIDDYSILEVSLCHTGARDGTGIISLAPVLCSSDDAYEDKDIVISVMSDPDTYVAVEPVAVEQVTPLDKEGFKKFQTAVLEWQKNGTKPDDWDEEKDTSIARYQVRKLAENDYLDDETSDFLMEAYGNEINREDKEREADRIQFSSIAETIARRHLSANGVKATPEQIEEARRRLIAESPQAASLPPEQLTSLVEISASMDAQNPQDINSYQQEPEQSNAMEDEDPVQSRKIELEIEKTKLENTRLQVELAKREAKKETVKHNQKMEKYRSIEGTFTKKTKFAMPEQTGREEQPVAKRQQQNSGFSYNLAKWGVDRAKPVGWDHSDPDWGRKKTPGMPQNIRSLHEFGVLNGLAGTHERFDKNVCRVGQSAVACSVDYENMIKGTKLDHPLSRNMDMAQVLFGFADAKPRLTDSVNGLYRYDQQRGNALVARWQ